MKSSNLNIIESVYKIWNGRFFIIKVSSIALVTGLIFAISLPKEYTTSVTMASESVAKSSTGNLGALASMAGINLGGGGGGETLSPNLYPDILRSTPFLFQLFNVKVTTVNGSTYLLYEYLDKHQQSPWWNYILSAPSYLRASISSLFTDKRSIANEYDSSSVFHITTEQSKVVNILNRSIEATVNQKSGLIYLSVTAQDPLVSAALTDTVMNNLQDYIIDYRTNKAKRDLEYTEKLYEKAKVSYYEAQQRYADFADSNLNIISSGYRTRLERLQNESSLAYGVYNQLAQQLQVSKARLQEVTPVYTIIQPSSVPISPQGPGKLMIIVIFLFVALLVSVVWLLYGKDCIIQLTKLRSNAIKNDV